MSKSQMKTMPITSFNIKVIVHYEFILQGETVNQAYYVEIFEWPHESVCREGPELWLSHYILQHDYAPAHKALSFKQFLAQKSITEMECPPSSSDLAPNDFWLFPKIKSALKG
jgi:hypothetical protein